MLIHPDKSLLLLIDLQERLVPAVEAPETLLGNCRWLLEVARHLEIPLMATEQYPQGIGATCACLRELIPDDALFEKTVFSCASEPACLEPIEARNPEQVVIAGTEAHVCVLQSALELLERGRQVYVVADCISSRKPADKALAIERMRQAGVRIVSREMVAFEWLRRAGNDRFRHISKNYLR